MRKAKTNKLQDDLDELSTLPPDKQFFLAMKHLRTKRRNIHWGIKDKDGSLLTTKEQILERWASFYADLYAESSVDPQTPIVITNELDIPLILETEIIDGINKLKKNKAPGVDKIYAEFLF